MGDFEQSRLVLIALGSNVGDRSAHLSLACDTLSQHARVEAFACSRLIETAPVGGPDQDRFLNAAARFQTTLSPTETFALLKATERQIGRAKAERWGPREVDLDLLLYSEEVIESDELVVPHPRMAFRRFVLEPAAEVAPEMRHPLVGWTIRELLEHLQSCPPYLLFVFRDALRRERLVERLVAATDLQRAVMPTFREFALPEGNACETLFAGDENERSATTPDGACDRPKLVVCDFALAGTNLGPVLNVGHFSDDEAIVEIVAAVEAMRQ